MFYWDVGREFMPITNDIGNRHGRRVIGRRGVLSGFGCVGLYIHTLVARHRQLDARPSEEIRNGTGAIQRKKSNYIIDAAASLAKSRARHARTRGMDLLYPSSSSVQRKRRGVSHVVHPVHTRIIAVPGLAGNPRYPQVRPRKRASGGSDCQGH